MLEFISLHVLKSFLLWESNNSLLNAFRVVFATVVVLEFEKRGKGDDMRNYFVLRNRYDNFVFLKI